MKRRFLLLLLALVFFVSAIAIIVSQVAARKSTEHLLMERAANRLSLIVWSFNATASDVDIYSYIDFEHETLTVTSNGMTVLQYGTASIDPGLPGLRLLEKVSGSYRFELLIDFNAELAMYLYPVRLTIDTIAAVYAALFAVFGLVFVSMVANPIARLAGAMDRITSRNLRVRIPVPRRKDEIRRLIVTFNDMMDDIAGTWERQVNLAEDLNHDIATPVQILEGYRQIIERHGSDPKLVAEFLEVAKVQLARLREMNGALKAALAAERVRRVERADATAITERNVRYYRELHPEIAITADIAKGVSLGIAPEDLERIEHILLDNAVKYGREGGRIEVTLSPGALSVRDFGMGIPPAEAKAIFERYHRAGEAGSRGPGSGIGLSILKRFSEDYGFGIGLSSEPGKGSAFTLEFQEPPPSR